MIIYHNMKADNAHRMLGINQSGLGKNVEKLSSGLRVNRAADDAAGLYISEKMRSQIRGLNQASRNALDGVSAVQTAEGALDEVHAMLQRMRELAVQAGNETNTSEDVQAIQDEINQLVEEIDSIAEKTEFNKQVLLNGTFSGKVLQTGANSRQVLSISIASLTAEGLGLASGKVVANKAGNYSIDKTKITLMVGEGTSAKEGVSISGPSNAKAGEAIASIDSAIAKVSKQRSKLGAIQNRLEHTIRNLDNAAENTQAAESRIRDVDMAKEMSTFTRNNILTQASQAMLAQANQLPQQVLQLLR